MHASQILGNLGQPNLGCWWASLSWDFDLTWCCSCQARASNNKHPLFFGLLKNRYFFVIACACSFVTREGVKGSTRQLNLLLVQRLSRAWHVAYITRLLFFHFFVACKFFFACFVVDPTFVVGDQGHEFARSAWGFPFSLLPGCVRCTRIVAVDAPVTIIVVMEGVSS